MLPVSLTWSLVAFLVPASCPDLQDLQFCPPGLSDPGKVQLDGFTPNISTWHPSPRQDQCSPFPSKLSRVTPTDTPAQLSADLFSLCDHLMLQTRVL